MVRAARLVVDTGIHALGWSRERAVNYMADNTALTKENIETEVNRHIYYISTPSIAGQVTDIYFTVLKVHHMSWASLYL